MTRGEKISLFITEDMADKLQQSPPWTDCKLCRSGYKTADDFCSCTEGALLKEILNVPPRYDVEFSSPAWQAIKTNVLQNKFILLKGVDLYAKLIAYDLGKQMVADGKIVAYVHSQMTMPASDHLALSQADVVIFNDLAGKISDINYKIELDERMDRNRPIIFINQPTLVNVSHNEDECVYDVFMCEVDALGIKVVGK